MSISSFLKRKFLKSLFFPSHNRGKALPTRLINLLKEDPGMWDLPELPEIGSSLSQEGLIPSAQNTFANKFNIKNCWFGVNGATGLIQSAIVSMANPGDYLLMPRNIHISVIKICILADIRPVFFDLQVNSATGQYEPISENWFKKVLEDNQLFKIKIAGVVLINPYYQGYATRIEPIIKMCHQKRIPVLVDEAHGSYFLFCEDFGLPKSAVRSNADLVVHSLHKSLNGLTQTAALWHNGNLIHEKKIARSIGLLQTSSPSSLLLASCEESIKDWLQIDNLGKYQKIITEAKIIYEILINKGIPLIRTQDPLKIVLNTGAVGIDGYTADKYFYKNGVIAELPEIMTLTFCLGFVEHGEFVEIFINLWEKLKRDIKPKEKIQFSKPPYRFVQIPEIPPSEAWSMDSHQIPIKDAVGKISAEIICPYPPGIPLLIPGEEIDKDRVAWISEQSLYRQDLVNSYVSVLT